MTTSAIVDLDAFLLPISEENPCGVDVREDSSPTSDYQTVKAARNAARQSERNNPFDDINQEADEHWRKVYEVAPKILKQQSKDLEVATWYTEAMVRKHGFAGLHDCFLIIESYINDFWDNLYPLPDEYGIETRVLPLTGLNGEGSEGALIAPIRNAQITEGNSVGPFTYWEYQQALEIQRVADPQARTAKVEKLGFSVETIETAVNETSSDYFVALRSQLSTSIDAYKKTSQKLDELCGPSESPPTRTIISILEECLGAIEHIAKHKFPIESAEEPESEDAEATDASDDGSTNTPVTKVVPGVIQNRDQAFKQLLDIATYFRKNEPHSPVSYVIEKAVRWGNLPLDALMQELIPDNNSRSHFSELTGVKAEDS